MMATMTAPEAATRLLEFVEPMPGFDEENSYALSAIDPNGLLLSMRSVREPRLRFVLTPSGAFFDDYRPDLAPVVTAALGATGPDDVELLLVLTIAEGLADATANLRAPIVVAPGTGRAMQVVLDDETLPMQRPLVDASA
jgi:flagellar assembly factor FliW